MTTSASPSNGVGSRLMMANFAPFCLACIGNILAGLTVKDDPRTINKSACIVSCSAFMKISCGNISPNNRLPDHDLPGSYDNGIYGKSRAAPLHFRFLHHGESHLRFA